MALSEMHSSALSIAYACSLTLACGTAHDEARQRRCDDVSRQIETALSQYVDEGNLLPGAVACELTPASFDPRVSPRSVELVLGQFSAACDRQAETCEGALVGPPPSLPPYDRPEPAIDPPEEPEPVTVR